MAGDREEQPVAKIARSPLSRDRVLETAMAIADAEGLAAVSMRRIASDLGVEAMSLYYHLPSKNALLDGLVERLALEILAESEASETGLGDWRDDVRARSLAARRVMIRHPWGPSLITSRAAIPVEVQAVFEAVLAAMIRGGLSYRVAHRGMHALSSMVLGFVQEPFSAPSADSAEQPVLDEAMVAAMADMFPHTAAMVAAELHEEGEASLGWCDTQTEFEFTLGLLLDGLDRAAAGS
jgi:AcrR family transcriptional regulator